MHKVEPQVFLMAASEINNAGLQAYLTAIGAEGWESDAGTSIEEIIEVASRGCYMSFGTEINPNLTRVREGNTPHLANILKSGHGSVLEHGWVTFAFHNVSRVVTHELVRHRAGTAVSQESLRVVRIDDLGFWRPTSFTDSDWDEVYVDSAMSVFEEVFKLSEDRYQELLGIAAGANGYESFDDLPLELKRKYTSAARRVLPIGVATNITWSCNMRSLRHVIEMRTDPEAEEEIRLVFNEVAEIATATWPNVFMDYERVWEGGPPFQYKFENRKV